MKNIFKILAFLPLLASCDDLFDPALENNREIDAMYNEPSFAQGVLANAYILLPYTSPYNTPVTNEVATDNAVTNDNTSTWLAMATGSWTSSNDPASQWQNRYHAIQYINLFLERCDDVVWSTDEIVCQLFKDRFKGEAYGLRALNMYHLLRAHAGWADDGVLYGVPIKRNSEDNNTNFNVPRDKFEDCINFIFEDCENALKLLPTDYKAHSEADVPQAYKDMGVDASVYDRVNGAHMGGRLSGRIVEAIRAQAALLAASPAFAEGSGVTMETAANYAAVVLDRKNGVSGIDADGYKWYANGTEIGSLAAGSNPDEILWRSDIVENLTKELENYPPSLYGTGRVNPTQNLVDAFPMANGYPINADGSGYDENDPYSNRDPRLKEYIICNGDTYKDTEIITATYGSNNDALNKESGHSTRTGYYMKKMLRSDCNPNPSYNTKQKVYSAYIRYTELYLDYAEAANEAWGPKEKGNNAYSAYDIIKAIRERAGITDTGYLDECAADKDKMRELIRNERRIELCFENHRFYDLRRWKVDLSLLTEQAKGVAISQGTGGVLQYNYIDVENRSYKDYMYYGPIPYNETLKYDQLKQNKGW
ncbi:RagB/SusD family nutrient uptake outer membrane protein [Bacteroides caecigallinarum]|uniref:RagB/SusD family nutrient uptake outer membrane protein n=1 Tax=Bacteroides caecigallinarum TaxID=1411144 RepID=UPI001F16F0FC|nr:RagB/SusD family nutrient uptake outer membrane protein [Bacteroides caecigallinarum]MCF2582822.1 RagB/SusD family nutrient uptake outer membrane protein [Bacteroides caecigallinarum]